MAFATAMSVAPGVGRLSQESLPQGNARPGPPRPDKPMRVVVPAFRAGQTLPRCIQALARSASAGQFEIVVVDDGQNGDLAESLAGLPVRIIDQGPSGSAAIARNRGAADFAGDVLVFVDADVACEPDAIETLVSPLRRGLAEAAVGNYSGRVDGMGFARQYKQLYLHHVYSRQRGYIRNHYWSAFGAIRNPVFREVGGFAPRFAGACNEDTELGQRLTAHGDRILAVPDACAANMKPFTVGSLIANDLRKGSAAVGLFVGSRIPMTDNRHSSRRDIVAVALAGLVLVVAAAALLLGWPPALAAATTTAATAAYLGARGDLLGAFTGRGPLFLLRCLLLMALLDLVRGACVALGLARLAIAGAGAAGTAGTAGTTVAAQAPRASPLRAAPAAANAEAR